MKIIFIVGHTKDKKRCKFFFDEVDVLQCIQAGPIPEEIWISLSSQEVQAHFKIIALPKTANDKHRGKLIARKKCPFNLLFNFKIINYK